MSKTSLRIAPGFRAAAYVFASVDYTLFSRFQKSQIKRLCSTSKAYQDFSYRLGSGRLIPLDTTLQLCYIRYYVLRALRGNGGCADVVLETSAAILQARRSICKTQNRMQACDGVQTLRRAEKPKIRIRTLRRVQSKTK